MVEKAIAFMPNETPMEKRDRALMAFLAITAVRVGALITLKLKHFDVQTRLVMQNPREVDTKFGKRIDTFLFPLNDTFEEIVVEWVSYLREDLLFGDHDPLFPKTLMGLDEDHCLRSVGLTREHWKATAQVREIVKKAFVSAGLPAFSPHRFRDMIVSEMYRRKLSVEEFKAWSQNLGHEHVMTTLTSYGRMSVQEQGRLVRGPLPDINMGKTGPVLRPILMESPLPEVPTFCNHSGLEDGARNMNEEETMSPEMFYAERKKAAAMIDPETASYHAVSVNLVDPYGVYPLTEDYIIGRVLFAHSPETGSVCFYDLPEKALARMRERVEEEGAAAERAAAEWAATEHAAGEQPGDCDLDWYYFSDHPE
jgi:hypothetical protein